MLRPKLWMPEPKRFQASRRRFLSGTIAAGAALIAAPRAKAWFQHGVPAGGPNPWPADATPISGATALTNAVRNGPDGTHYLLAPGDYGAWDPGFQPRYTKPAGSSPVHIWGQPGVTFTSVGVGSGKFIHFHYLTTVNASLYGFSAGSCTDVAFDHCKSVGAAQKGFNLANNTDCALSWCKVENTGVGIAWVTCTNLTMTDCWVDSFSADAFDIFGCTGGTVARCMSSSSLPDTGHPDSFQISSYSGTRTTDLTVTDFNFDRNGGTQTNGPVFCDGSDRVTWTNIAGFGVNHNGLSISDVTESSVTNAFVQGYDYDPIGVIRAGTSLNNSMTNVQTVDGCVDYNDGSGLPVGSTFTNCTTIPLATDLNDRALYEAFLAANPTIPTTAHWAGAGYI